MYEFDSLKIVELPVNLLSDLIDRSFRLLLGIYKKEYS